MFETIKEILAWAVVLVAGIVVALTIGYWFSGSLITNAKNDIEEAALGLLVLIVILGISYAGATIIFWAINYLWGV